MVGRLGVPVGGSYRFIDYCHEDEISIIELTTIATEMGQHYSNDYFVTVNGENILLKSDLEVMQLPKLVDCNGVVHVYIRCNLEDIIPTQGSQIGNGGAKTKTMSSPKTHSQVNPIPKPIQNPKPIPKPIMKPKPFVKPRVSVKPNPTAKGKGVVQDEEDTDKDEYDPDSDFCESDNEVEDDDAMFDKNVDAEVEFSGLEDHSLPHDYEYAAAVEGLTNVDGDSDVVSCDELRSPCNSDDEEGLGAQSKHTTFNEKTNMINPVFEPNMEFKTHALGRDAVKEYSIKWGLQTRFLKCDREKVRVKMQRGLYTFMTDKQKGLIDAVGQVFPNASHRFSVRHLYNNFKGDFKGLHLKEIPWKTARASTVAAFTKAMEEMKRADPKALAWLIERPPVNWSRSHFDTFPKCDILLNNLCESLNAAILSARDKPIITMLERIRMILIQTTQKRLEAMKRCKDPICPKIKKRLDLLRGEKGWIARYCGNGNFEIVGPYEQYKVNLENKTCGCRKWELSGIPYVHAVCGYNHLHMDPMHYVHDCYKVTTYLSGYGNGLGPINGREMWPTTDHPIILPPDVKKRAGRLKKAGRREPEEQEPVGHNKRSCKGDPTAATTEEGSNAATAEGPNAPTEQAPNAATQQGSTSQMSGGTRQNGATSQSGVSIVPATRLKLPVKRNRGAERTAGQVQKRN
ncbi:hypothetical protein RHSIM_Rhsim05G0107300 [Rhododendron simsii]|uniref:Zinc finger PMZ-type domain-containing protein n=1 Tax=Rhododendron simsii TaxID=118357 RepID=A0A834LNS6_RHOSS|nr:hypothetical protein RHSIM_Rhsim05G0107300 [Rhododendron simsii]